jgi:nucleoside-diphosphate-sugar epimerase
MIKLASHAGYYRTARVLVLGASGFIGRWVARSLCARGAKVGLVVRHRTSAEQIFHKFGVRGDIYELDLRASLAVRNLFEEFKPAITFNLAGYGVDPSERDEETAYQINAQLVQAMCEAAAETRDREWPGQDIIHVGSALEYGSLGGSLTEDSVPHPTTLYGKSKLAGTRFLTRCCQTYQVKGLTARLFTVYGPGEHQGRLLPSLLETAQTRKPLALTTGKQKRDFTYVEDVAEGLLRLGLATTRPGEIVNLATGQLTSVRGFAETAGRILGIPTAHLKFGLLPTRAEEMEHAPVAVERLQRLTAWLPQTGIAEGVRKTLDFESSCGDQVH